MKNLIIKVMMITAILSISSLTHAWDQSRRLLEVGTNSATDPRIATGNTGTAIAVWEQNDGSYPSIYANVYNGTGWQGATEIETNSNDATNPQISMNDSGMAIAVWQQSDGTNTHIYTNIYDGSNWSSATVLTTTETGNAIEPQVSLNNNGDAIVVWDLEATDGIHYLYTSTYSSSSGWSTPVSHANSFFNIDNPQVFLNDNGLGAIVWEHEEGGTNNIQTSIYYGSGIWTSVETVDEESGDANDPQVAISSDNVIFVVWSQEDSTGISNIHEKRLSNLRTSINDPHPILFDIGSQDAYSPQISINNTGKAVVVWEHSDISGSLLAANIYENGGWSGGYLIPSSSHPSSPVVSINDNNQTMAVWQEENNDDTSIYFSTFTFIGYSWENSSLLVGVSEEVEDSYEPQVSLNNDGKAFIVYKEGGDIYASILEPACGDSIIDFNEECDDGNTTDGDCCSSACLAETSSQWHPDTDGDGYGNVLFMFAVSSCSQPSGYVADSSDCDETDANIHPGATEDCSDSIDSDCNDNPDTFTLYADNDEDGYGDQNDAGTEYQCDATIETPVSDNNSDCDDTSNSISPTSSEICGDSMDNDCDGSIDEEESCTENNPETIEIPTVPEVCNGVDDDGNGIVDDGLSNAFYQDSDGDGEGNLSVASCSQQDGYVGNYDDCDDTNASINTGTTETCGNDVDENCDNNIEACEDSLNLDDDADGINDEEDNCPLTVNADQTDTDADDLGDACDLDDDGDNTPDKTDDAPLDATETTDSDGDGTGDNADTDDDNDSILDTEDTDDDGDGTDDVDETQEEEETEPEGEEIVASSGCGCDFTATGQRNLGNTVLLILTLAMPLGLIIALRHLSNKKKKSEL